MTTGEKILTGFVILLIVTGIYFLGTALGWWKNIFASKPPISTQTDAEKCTEANKSKKDGEECSNCVAEGSGMPSFNGVIKDGTCVRTAQPASVTINLRKIRIKANGAIPYVYINGNFVSPKVSNKIPAGTELTVLQVAKPFGTTYYNTSMGWIIETDADVIM